jgi:Protein of unknown function (DUF1592)/Protein of unknown function (DUF1588)/Protein of unknown function (DUF1585)/Protein of unknown function (DUF1587)/Protein of unknown function (DUF1595)
MQRGNKIERRIRSDFRLLAKCIVAMSLVCLVAGAEEAKSGATAASSVPFVKQYCTTCHNDKLRTSGLTLENIDVNDVSQNRALLEKLLRRVRFQQMPPAGARQPAPETRVTFVAKLEASLDQAVLEHPKYNALVHRLNRAEYVNAIRDLLGFQIDDSLIPPDDSSYGFDNVADVQHASPMLMERYVSVSRKIASLAVGDTNISPIEQTYHVPADLNQDDHFSGLPFGTRGGWMVQHKFPVGGKYRIRVRLMRELGGVIRGVNGPDPIALDVLADGAILQKFSVGGMLKQRIEGHGSPYDLMALLVKTEGADDGLVLETNFEAGTHAIAATFIQNSDAVDDDVLAPFNRPYLDSEDGRNTGKPYVLTLAITGPLSVDPKLTADSPYRRPIFVCKSAQANEEEPCAQKILSRLGRLAYRRPLTQPDLQPLMALYNAGRKEGGFDSGIELGLRGILVSPDFLLRESRGQKVDASGRISDIALASRLSFFLWSSIPDDELLRAAENGTLHEPAVLEKQVHRMLSDERSNELVNNFFGQWLWTRNLRDAVPDQELYPNFDENVRESYRHEVELFAASILREGRSVLDFLDADYTFVDETLARYYQIPGVYGSLFQRVTLPADSPRRGILGKGSFLITTSTPLRTSPVIRGKWILENLLGTPPPPPPPNIPSLAENKVGSQPTTVRERLAQHRANPVCASCHKTIDPLGLSLENFDATGFWREKSDGAVVDATSVTADGTKLDGVAGLRRLLLSKPEMFATTFTDKLMTYALGRGLDFDDAPSIRKIVREAAPDNYKVSSIVLGIINSPPFQMTGVEE